MLRKTSDRLCRRGYDGDIFIATYESDGEIGHADAGDLMRKYTHQTIPHGYRTTFAARRCT